jgi:hypothetical protein
MNNKFIGSSLDDFLEDLMDISIIKQRRNEPSRSLDDYLAERKKS